MVPGTRHRPKDGEDKNPQLPPLFQYARYVRRMEGPPTPGVTANAHSERQTHARSFGSTTPTLTATLDVSQSHHVPADGDGDGARDGDGDSEERDLPPLPAPPLWQHRLSASFSAMAEQITAASQALVLVPPTVAAWDQRTETGSGTRVGQEDLAALYARLEAIERAQTRLASDLDALKTSRTSTSTSDSADEIAPATAPDTAPDTNPSNARFEGIDEALSTLRETVRLDQARLPARLHNAAAVAMRATLRAPVMANGKPAPGFPATRGEFEHITKERYEALLKAYGEPTTGDTATKRDRLRAFAGIPGL